MCDLCKSRLVESSANAFTGSPGETTFSPKFGVKQPALVLESTGVGSFFCPENQGLPVSWLMLSAPVEPVRFCPPIRLWTEGNGNVVKGVW